MSITPFIITPEITEKLTEMKEYSEANPYSTDDLLDMINGTKTIAGDMPEHSIYLEFGWKIVFSVNMQPQLGLIRQMSMSLRKPKALPNPHVLELVMPFLGFTKGLKGCHVELEDCGEDVQAVNVAEIISST